MRRASAAKQPVLAHRLSLFITPGLALLVGCGGSAAPAPASLPELYQDADVDGLPDARDACPSDAEDGNPPLTGDGCPNRDLDADGILVPADLCPLAPETRNGAADDDGCPDLAASLEADRIRFSQTLPPLWRGELSSSWRPVLQAAARTLAEHPELELVEVAVYDPGGLQRGSWLSLAITQKQATMVRRELVALGIAPGRLLSRGYGNYCLATRKKSAPALEFVVRVRNGQSTGADAGCEAATRAIKLPEPVHLPTRPLSQ